MSTAVEHGDSDDGTDKSGETQSISLIAESEDDVAEWVMHLVDHGWHTVEHGADELSTKEAFNAEAFAASGARARERRRRASLVAPRQTWWLEEGLRLGTSVTHPKRGHGVVVAVEPDPDTQEIRVHVRFDAVTTGGIHRYNEASWMRKMQHDASVTRVLEGMLRAAAQQEEESSPRAISTRTHMDGWSLYRLYSDSRVQTRHSLMSARETEVISIPHGGFGIIRINASSPTHFALVVGTLRFRLIMLFTVTF